MKPENFSDNLKRTVTLGICVKNCGKYIREALKSIADQDYPHSLMKIIFVDGCSEDDTTSIIRECSSKMDIEAKIFSDCGRGLGHARNVVATNASSDFVLWVDGDMVLSKNFVTTLVRFIEEHPKVGIVKGKQALESGGNLLATLEGFSRAAGKMVDYQSEGAYSKVLGTSGSIYRTSAIIQIGGFDEGLKGYGEDWDIEIRARAAGWSLLTTNAQYLDYERHKLTWKNLWRRYWRRGYDTHYFLHKNRGVIKHYKMFPPAAFLSGLLNAYKLFKITNRKSVYLLPFQYVFKMSAWYIGFIRSHLNSYEP